MLTNLRSSRRMFIFAFSTSGALIGSLMVLVLYTTRAALVVLDSLVLVLTWMKTFQQWKQSRHLNLPPSIAACFLRDGKYDSSSKSGC